MYRISSRQSVRVGNYTELSAIAIRETRFRGFKLFYENETATDSMIRAIDDFPSFFTPCDAEPTIIDCGANIGISVLEWKTRWPSARVLCFEPDPDAFRLLQMNIDRNDLPGVQCVEAALSDIEGHCRLFGELGKGSDARGNSIHAPWGDRPGTSSVDVPCRKLSPYLSAPVAFLKMDIEGAEERVLREISLQLCHIEAIYVEVHETAALAAENSVERIVELISSAGFTIESESRFEPHALPPHLDAWRQQVGATQTQLMCWRS